MYGGKNPGVSSSRGEMSGGYSALGGKNPGHVTPVSIPAHLTCTTPNQIICCWSYECPGPDSDVTRSMVQGTDIYLRIRYVDI